MGGGRVWTAQEIAAIGAMAADGKDVRAIAAHLGRTVDRVQQKARENAILLPKLTYRQIARQRTVGFLS